MYTANSSVKVLYKRKPVTLAPPPHIEKNTDVHLTTTTLPSQKKESDARMQIWVMPKSEEIFTDYDSYLRRYAFTLSYCPTCLEPNH